VGFNRNQFSFTLCFMGLKKISLYVLFIFSFSSSIAQRIAIVGAMPEEIKLLTDTLKQKKIIKKDGLVYYKGKIHTQKVVILKGGIGKVNAAYSTTKLISRFKVSKIIFTGVAGGVHPESYPGDMVVATSVFHHDYAKHLADQYIVRATTNLDGKLNPLYFKSDSLLLLLAKSALSDISFEKVNGHKPQVFFGKIATGDVFLSNTEKAKWLYREFDAFATEMEGAALGQIAFQNHIPFLVIRSCSDNANNQAHVDFNEFKKPAADNAIRLVMGILDKM
jgi:adenosylhomocysteine nucleosidase